jgi:ATP-dependent 26S proteasome regulatory subunit
LRDRPSRFDVVLEMGLPKIDARRQILTRHLARQMPDAEVIERAARETDGLSGAQLREVAFLAVQQAIFRGDVPPSGVARLIASDITAAVERLTGGRKQNIGFHAQA